MMKRNLYTANWIVTALFAAAFTLGSCGKKSKSEVTGQAYNNPKWGGFSKLRYKGQETGPGLVLVEGGSFTMGATENDILFNNDNVERHVTVNSFYMDETEISNTHYREYLEWITRVYTDYPEVLWAALPDTNCWRSKLGFNEPFVEYYLRHPAYQDYPVVGVSWKQANDFAAWRGDRVNEMILDREGVANFDVLLDASNENNMNTRAYLANQYEFAKVNNKGGLLKKKSPLRDYRQKKKKNQVRGHARMEDGILLPEYRLPTEAEWEYAAQANVGNTQFNNVEEKKIFGWNDYTIRIKEGKEKDRGKIRMNVMVGKGDHGGIANGTLNDGGFITTPVFSYWPNDYGLYNMQGNVSEWVLDVYRPLTLEDYDEFMPYRGNVYKTVQLDQYGYIDEKDSLGRLKFRDVTEEENVNRRNYKKSDNIGFKDEEAYSDELTYEYGVTSLINNKAHVYKGGGWDDRNYWTVPGTRRYLDEKQSTSSLGFRCAMIRVGAPVGNSKKKYNKLPTSGINKKTKRRRR